MQTKSQKRLIFNQFNCEDGKYQTPVMILYKSIRKLNTNNEWWVMVEFPRGHQSWMDKESVENFARVKVDWKKIRTV